MILFDTGPLFAFADPNDQYHEESQALLQDPTDIPIVPALVIPEMVFLLATRIGVHAEERFLQDLVSGAFVVESVDPTDWQRIAQLVAQYRDFPLGTVDASISAAAERLGVTTIATFDGRHFAAVRPAHIDAFDLVP